MSRSASSYDGFLGTMAIWACSLSLMAAPRHRRSARSIASSWFIRRISSTCEGEGLGVGKVVMLAMMLVVMLVMMLVMLSVTFGIGIST